MSLCHHCCLGIGILTDKELEFVGEWEATAIGVSCFYMHAKTHFPFLQEQEIAKLV